MVYILEDDHEDRVAICEALASEGFRWRTATSGVEFLSLLGSGPPDVVVLNIGLPDVDGRDVCRSLRTFGLTAPILFLTGKGHLVDRLAGFDAGGDDYVVKPFAPTELVARIRALRELARRTGGGEPDQIGFHLDAATHAAVSADTNVRLSPTEYRVLAALAERPGEVVRRLDLIRGGWPRGAMVQDNTLDAYVGRLRRKLNALPDPPEIETVHGVGYMLQNHASSA